MAITAITPASGLTIDTGDSASFTIDDTYTSLVIKAQTATALVVVYSTALGGGQSGYTVSVQDNGDGTHTVTYSADAGYDTSPQLIYVVEDETGSEATTNLSYTVEGESAYPQGSYPYNSQAGANDAAGVTSFIGRDGVVLAVAGDYDAYYYTEAEIDAIVAAYLPLAGGQMVGNVTCAAAETFDGRDLSVDGAKLDLIEALADVTDTDNVRTAGALMDDEVDANLKTFVLPASTTISAYGATLVDDADAATARTTLDAARAMLSGAGLPGGATGDGYPLGTTYADTTNDVGYVLVDATTGLNVWWTSAGGSATYLSGAGAPGAADGDGEDVGTTYIDTTADEAYFLTDNTAGVNVWSTSTAIAAAKAITLAMMADGTDGELITWSTSGVAATVAVGTATHVLTSNGVGTKPTFQASAGGGGGLTTLVSNELIAIDATEVVIGGAVLDGSSGGTYAWACLATYNDNGGTGNQDLTLYLYDRGAVGTPVAGVLRSTLLFDTSVDGLDTLLEEKLTLTGAASPGTDTDEIDSDEPRMYEIRAKLDAAGAVDTALILNVKFTES